MNIMVDLTYVFPGSVAGVTQYAYRLLAGLRIHSASCRIVLLVTKNNRTTIEKNCPGYECIEMAGYSPWLHRRIPHLTGYACARWLRSLIAALDIHVFYSPYLNVSSFQNVGIPHVGVLHDVQTFLLKRPQRIKGFLFEKRMDTILGGLARLITISHYSQKQIQAYLPRLRCPVNVVYNCVGVEAQGGGAGAQAEYPYILNVNALEPYKNLITLILSFGLLKDKIPHQLVVKACKTPYWETTLVPLVNSLGIAHRVKLIDENYTSAQMAMLYAQATLFVTPSLMEGFGYTPIEAALYRVPVISSKESSLYEVTKGKVHYYEPASSPQALADSILHVLGHRPPDAELESIARSFAEEYSPEQQCRQTIQILEQVHGSSTF